jgi:glutathione S-transferase
MSNLQLMSTEECPFAQRTMILMAEKDLTYEYREVDLNNKTDWFEAASPYSKVPVLIHGDVSVYESSIVNEYLNETFPEPPMMPDSPAERAQARIWIDYDNVKFVPAFYKVLLAKDEGRRQELADTLIESLRFMESQALAKRKGGPYWLGNSCSLVDIALYPHFERLVVLEFYRGISMPDECGALREWLAAMAERPCVKRSAHDAEYHIKAYTRYADGSANGTTAKDMRN